MRAQTTAFGEVIVRFHHERHDETIYVSPVSQKKKAIEETYTECEIILDPTSDTPTRIVGRSYLNPADNFDKEVGRRLSLDRALATVFELDGNKHATFSPKTQREIWVGYFSR